MSNLKERKYKTLKIHEKDYVPTKERVQAFREDHPEWGIETNIVFDDGVKVVMKTTVTDEKGRVVATGIAHEVVGHGKINGTSHYENCETSAVGRALGFMGYGINESIATSDEYEQAIKSEEERDTLLNEVDKLISELKMTDEEVNNDMANFQVYVPTELDNNKLSTYIKILNKRLKGQVNG